MPKGKYIEPTTKRTYTLETLQKLRHDADMAGDIATRDILSAKIVAQGGVIPTSEIPADETKLSRLERLRQEALDVNDTVSASILAEKIAEEQVEDVYEQVTDDTAPTVGETYAEEAHAPHEGRSLVEKGIDPSKPPNWTQRVMVHNDPTDGGMNVHTPTESKNGLPDDIWDNHQQMERGEDGISSRRKKFLADKQNGRESDEQRLEGPEATESINDGTASVNAQNMIDREKYNIAEIPARMGGKLDVKDVKDYKKLLTAV